MLADPSSLKEIKTAQIALTCPYISTSSFNSLIKFPKKKDQIPNRYLKNHINKT